MRTLIFLLFPILLAIFTGSVHAQNIITHYDSYGDVTGYSSIVELDGGYQITNTDQYGQVTSYTNVTEWGVTRTDAYGRNIGSSTLPNTYLEHDPLEPNPLFTPSQTLVPLELFPLEPFPQIYPRPELGFLKRQLLLFDIDE